MVKEKATSMGDIEALKEGIVAVLVSPSFLLLNTEDIEPSEDEEILKKVIRLPVATWRYREDVEREPTGKHIGPMAEDFNATFGLSGEKKIAVVDAVGVNLAATKALAKKVDRIEANFGLAA